MPEPKIELIPIRNGLRSDGPTTLDVLVRIIPPTPEVHFVRPPINLGLVIDRSGSMAGAKKMDYARAAACFAVEQLLPSDQISVTIFDSEVETIAPNAPAVDKPGLIRRIGEINPRGATALHAGWKEGGNQVEKGRLSEGLNRVILLSDGLANEGVTDPNAIAADVRALAARGVGTTTMGLGDDYNEDLMQAMGEAGDGNYYYIESPVQLVDIFHTEMMGLMANLGQKVSLGLEPEGGSEVVEVLNDLERNALGRLMLPNLVVGIPIPVVVRLKIPPTSREAEVCRFRLAWDDPHGEGRRTLRASLVLPVLPSTEWEALANDPEVAEQVALMMAARAKKEAIAAYDRGDMLGTMGMVDLAYNQTMAMPGSPMIRKELDEIAKLKADLAQGEGAKFRKRSAWQAFTRKRGQDT
jgi:Ca-activated chloride channel family protein